MFAFANLRRRRSVSAIVIVVTPNAVTTNSIANIDANVLHLENCLIGGHVVDTQDTGRIPNPETGPALPLAPYPSLVADEPLVIHKLVHVVPGRRESTGVRFFVGSIYGY
jgi:hypothetical protein